MREAEYSRLRDCKCQGPVVRMVTKNTNMAEATNRGQKGGPWPDHIQDIGGTGSVCCTDVDHRRGQPWKQD